MKSEELTFLDNLKLFRLVKVKKYTELEELKNLI